jgi:hypothetical protein
VRRFPKAAASFQEIVNDRGRHLRQLPYDTLERMTDEPVENLMVESRRSTISIIVEKRSDEQLRIVVQGFMEAGLLPGKHVALDGFYKSKDGTIGSMPETEFYEFD